MADMVFKNGQWVPKVDAFGIEVGNDVIGAGETFVAPELELPSDMDVATGRFSGDTLNALPKDTSIFNSNMFSGENIGGTMQGIGAIAGAAAGMYDAYNKKKYQDKVFGMEEKRVARETARQDKQQAAYDKVFG